MTSVWIDSDIVAYRCAAVNENNDAPLALWQADELILRILEDTNASDYKCYLSGDNNFRYSIYPDYKKHRRDKPKPKHLEAIREHLVLKWNAEICDGYEADDAIGIRMSSDGGICASIDKDMLQIPGTHFNFVRREISEIDEQTGWKNFYLQVLTGDPADYIPGCPGIGKVKAPRILQECQTPLEMYQACIAAYLRAEAYLQDMHRNAQLLYIWRREKDQWLPPLLKPEPVQTL